MVAIVWILIALVLIILIARLMYTAPKTGLFSEIFSTITSISKSNAVTEILLICAVLLILLMAFLYYLQDIISLAINGLILYLLFLRIHAEIKKHKKRIEAYVIAGLISFFGIWFIGNPLPVWRITSIGIIGFALIQAYLLLKKQV
ncbi:MAG: hypothetical protein Q7K43_03625 [Candidatus Woesearchaeota archaeon]|nr:hypothetical protein [Candidatus Woesearchaeota archaeon]